MTTLAEASGRARIPHLETELPPHSTHLNVCSVKNNRLMTYRINWLFVLMVMLQRRRFGESRRPCTVLVNVGVIVRIIQDSQKAMCLPLTL